MAIPFKVFDYSGHGMQRENQVNYVWCVRCEAWIPFEEAFGGPGSACDPHIMDHLHAWQMLRNGKPAENHSQL